MSASSLFGEWLPNCQFEGVSDSGLSYRDIVTARLSCLLSKNLQSIEYKGRLDVAVSTYSCPRHARVNLIEFYIAVAVETCCQEVARQHVANVPSKDLHSADHPLPAAVTQLGHALHSYLAVTVRACHSPN